MFPSLSHDILADMDSFQVLAEALPDDPRCHAVVQALQSAAAEFADWPAEADPVLRKEKQTLHAGLLAAAQICQAARQ